MRIHRVGKRSRIAVPATKTPSCEVGGVFHFSPSLIRLRRLFDSSFCGEFSRYSCGIFVGA